MKKVKKVVQSRAVLLDTIRRLRQSNANQRRKLKDFVEKFEQFQMEAHDKLHANDGKIIRLENDARRQEQFSKQLLLLLNIQDLSERGFKPVVSPIDGNLYTTVEELAEHMAEARVRLAPLKNGHLNT